jgi:hypothetical protein
MGLKERIAQPEANSQHEQNEPGDQNIDQPTFAFSFTPVSMI